MKNINNKQLSVLNKLFSYFQELDTIENKRFQETQYHISRYGDVDVKIDIKYDIEAEPWKESILVEISNIYEIAKEHNIYFFDCPFKIYESNFESRKNKFFEEYIDATELDFLLYEVDYFFKPFNNRVFTVKNKVYNYSSFFVLKKKYILSLKRKLEFLDSKINSINSILTTSLTNNSVRSFNSLVTDKNKQEYVYDLLEHFGAINSKRIATLTQRKKGVLRGVVEALLDKKILPQVGLHDLCFSIAKDIGLELKSKLDYHSITKKTHIEAKEYIEQNPFQ